MANPTNATTPVGRLIMGSVYVPQDTDADGNPLVNKSGANVGQPRVNFFFAVAIPKGGEQHWSQTAWGAPIWACGHAAFPQAAQSEAFAWKVSDGDSTKANLKGKRPCDQEGSKGHWILRFGSGFAPKIYNRDGTKQLVEVDAVKPGYFVQVNFDVEGNGSQQKPGVYLNHKMVALSAYGPEIFQGPDVAQAGFGAAPLPAGALAAPVGGFNPAPAAAPAPAVLGYAAPGAPVPAYAPAPAQVQQAAPNPAFLVVPGGMPPPPPALPVPVAPPAAPTLTTKAGGATYQQMRDAGWTDDMMRAHGYMV